jgi:hypothetical protein
VALVDLDGLPCRIGDDPTVGTGIDVVFELLALSDAERFVKEIG